ncbi:MAG TPA: hypothetical protein VFF65_02135, partial [Phycisphaerales bacterium]|nr:hypothetical protein [Phycisphaerales bacterium]
MASGSSSDVLMLSVSGMRGTFGGTLTPEVVTRYCGAFASWVREQRGPKKAGRPRVVVGFDGRAGSETVAVLAGAALQLHGCDVTMLPAPMMTPSVGVVVDSLGADAGIQATASHNPQQWCGLKPIVRAPGTRKGAVNASAPDKVRAEQVIARYRADDSRPSEWSGVGVLTAEEVEVVADHPAMVLGIVKDLGVLAAIKKARLHVALDSVTSSGLWSALLLLDELGVKTSGVNDAAKLADGLFPHTPEPTRDNLVGLSRFVKKAKGRVDVGFAQDPDGDRLAVVDEQGTYIGEEYTLVLAAMAMGELGLLKKGQVLAVNLSTSRMIEDVAGWYGCHVVRTAVGEANVVEGMRANRSPIGGEGNGGVIWPRVTYVRDSLSAMAMVLALMGRTGRPLSALVDGLPRYAIEKRKVDLASRELAEPALKSLREAYAGERVDVQ